MSIDTELDQIKKGNVQPIYLVHGTEKFLNEKVRKTFETSILDPEEQEFNFGRFDMDTSPVDQAIEEALSAPFFGDKRLIFVDNAYFLTAKKPKDDIEHDLNWLEEYVSNPSPDSVMVIFAPYEKMDQRKKIVKTIKKHTKSLTTSALSEKETRQYLNQVIHENDYHVDGDALNLLLQLTGSHLSTGLKELNKLMLYALDEKVINKQMVEELTVKGLEENVFELVEFILQKKTSQSLTLFESLLKQKEEPIKIIALLLSQFRLLLQVKILKEKGYQQGDITKFLKIHPYRVKLAAGQERNFSYQDLSHAFNGLIETDYQLKTGYSQPEVQFELFVLSFSDSINQKKNAAVFRS